MSGAGHLEDGAFLWSRVIMKGGGGGGSFFPLVLPALQEVMDLLSTPAHPPFVHGHAQMAGALDNVHSLTRKLGQAFVGAGRSWGGAPRRGIFVEMVENSGSTVKILKP